MFFVLITYCYFVYCMKKEFFLFADEADGLSVVGDIAVSKR
jgi:hypothetical protein